MNKARALERLKEKGHKYTGKREDLLSFFYEQNGYRTARDVKVVMEDKYPGISFDTIYRNLHLFVDLDLLEVTELEGEKHFRMKCESKHHHHFICLACGKTKEIHTCPMQQVSGELREYTIENHKFEIYGKCPSCQA